jgi:aryl-alcohol dehydrogenase-like predicted oxidoreductase
MNYGMANATGQPSEQQSFEILDTAAAAGINSLDTAVAYGTSEQVIGHYLRQSENRFTVTSKFKVAGDDPLKELEAQQQQTQEHLGNVDLYFFHDAHQMRTYGEQFREPLERMRAEGRTKLLGASIYEVPEIEEFLEHDWLQAIQVPMNILDGRIVRSGLLEELRKRGAIVFVRSVFLQGLLCMEHVPEKYEFLAPYVEELRDIARSEEMTLRELSVAYIRDLPGVTSLVLGCETAAQVRDNAELISVKSISPSGTEAICRLAERVPIEAAMDRICGRVK